MPQFLPLRANLEWLKKSAKERLRALQAADATAQLSDAQLAVAREYGFSSWRALVAHVNEVREKLREILPADAATDDGAAPIQPDDPDLARLFAVVQAGDVDAATAMLKQRPALAKARGQAGQTPLHVAAEHDDARIGVVLLAYGADPNEKYGESGHTALTWAATCRSLGFANALVKLGARPDFFGAAGIGALEEVHSFFDASGELIPGASHTGSSRFARDGSHLPCPPSSPIEQISDALCMAARNAHADVVRFLLTKKPDLSFRGFMGATALHWAYFGGDPAIVQMLIDAGADPSVRDVVLRCTPRAFGICAPANWGFLFLVRDRLEKDPSLLNFTDGRTTALHEAAREGRADVVRHLLERGADRTQRDGDGRTALDLATDRGHDAIAKMLQGG